MSKIVLLIESFFLNNSSGINTFIKNMCIMFPDNIIIVTDCEESIRDLSWYKKHNIQIIYNSGSMDDYSEENYKKQIISNLYKLDKTCNYIMIANSFITLSILNEYNLDEFKYKTLCYYTHIGDILDPDKKDIHDFKDINISKIFEYLKNENINILTQTNCVKKRLLKLLNKDSIVLPEPLYVDGLDIFKKNNKTVLIIASNYKRKRFDLMLKLLSNIDCNIKILCDSITGYYDIYHLLKTNNISTKNIVILENINHAQLKQHIIGSKCLLHISDIEVCPYSVLEASIYIPTIINNNNVWSKDFNNISYMIDPNNEKESISIINNILNTDVKTLFNYEEYKSNSKDKWVNLIGGNNFDY